MLNTVKRIIESHNENTKTRVKKSKGKITQSTSNPNVIKIRTRQKHLCRYISQKTVFRDSAAYLDIVDHNSKENVVEWFCECYYEPGFNDIEKNGCIGSRPRNKYLPHYDKAPKWFWKFQEFDSYNNFYYSRLSCTNYTIKISTSKLKEMIVSLIFSICKKYTLSTHIAELIENFVFRFNPRENEKNYLLAIY